MNQFKRQVTFLLCLLLASFFSYGQNSYPNSGDIDINNANIKIRNIDTKGLLLYQTDKNRFGQIVLNKDGGTGLGTLNTLLIEAGNGYGVDYGQRILFKTAGSDRLVIEHDGNVGIGTTDPKNKLSVNGTIWAQEVKVMLDDAADWVFEDDYELRSLVEVETFIKDNKHLPDVPSADEFREQDMNVAEMNNKLLQKIEELTLYLIEQNKEIELLKRKMQEKETDHNKPQ